LLISSNFSFFGAHFSFRPAEFDTVLMAMSGFEDLTRNQLKRLCAKINLRLSETFKKNCTHLLLGGREQATADKRQRAAQWGVKCVCEGWLYQCLKRVSLTAILSALSLNYWLSTNGARRTIEPAFGRVPFSDETEKFVKGSRSSQHRVRY
jgi:hypothetical protein